MTDETNEEWRGIETEATEWGELWAAVLCGTLRRAVAHGVRLEQGQVEGATLDADAIERGEVTSVDGPASPPTQSELGGGVRLG